MEVLFHICIISRIPVIYYYRIALRPWNTTGEAARDSGSLNVETLSSSLVAICNYAPDDYLSCITLTLSADRRIANPSAWWISIVECYPFQSYVVVEKNSDTIGILGVSIVSCEWAPVHQTRRGTVTRGHVPWRTVGAFGGRVARSSWINIVASHEF